MKIRFLGAAGSVTGSKYLLESKSGQRVLIDCGMFQGLKKLRLKNWEKFPVDLQSISAVLLTHAHIDHSGYLPRIVREGYRGPVYSTAPTHALAEVLLRDSARLKEEAADYANRKKFSRHQPALPLYTLKDAEKSLKLFRTKKLKEEFILGDFRVKFYEAGHILGAASILIEADGKSIFFSGDIGGPEDLLISAAAKPAAADYIVMESTYGDRLHAEVDAVEEMRYLVASALDNKSVLMIPSFAVGRAQVLLYCLYLVFKKYPHLKMPVYLNSPMAQKVTEMYQQFRDEHKLDEQTCDEVCEMAICIEDVAESIELNKKSGPMVIVSASGMLTGGRILHHLQAFGDDPKNIILLAGFQAAGTRGADLARGERMIKFFGYYHNIKAQIKQFDFFSAHADQKALLAWLASAKEKPGKVFLSHGEPVAADVLRRKIEEEFALDVHVAEYDEEFEL